MKKKILEKEKKKHFTSGTTLASTGISTLLLQWLSEKKKEHS